MAEVVPGPAAAPVAAPVVFDVRYPDRLSRWHLLLKSFLGWLYVLIPHVIVLYVYGILAGLASLIGFLAILFTRQFPKGLFNFVVGYQRWTMRVQAYLYLMVDAYPPFSTSAPESPVSLDITYPEKLSRGKALLKFFLGWLYVGIPHGIVLAIYGIAVFVVVFISWFAILFTGKFPRGFFDFTTGFFRWSSRVAAYQSFLRDEYPPFNGRP